jgi:hypothetical protein
MRWIILSILVLVFIGCAGEPERKVITKKEYEDVMLKEEGR